MKNTNTCIVLTCTIDVRGVAFTERSDTDIRHEDYKRALSKWLKNQFVDRIILVENSNYDLSELKQVADAVRNKKKVEFISFDGQDFPRHLGKGYGEAKALARVVSESALLGETEKFIKVNGRYYVPNIYRFMSRLQADVDVMTDLSKGLLWSDSRVFGGTAQFIRNYLCPEGNKVNDSDGFFLEHALACATHRAIADGLKWMPLPCTPYIDGISGTANRQYKQSLPRRFAKDIYLLTKEAIISR